MFDLNNYFWRASVEELKQGYTDSMESGKFTCLICGEDFENGVIYPSGNRFFDAERAVKEHISECHGSPFMFFLEMGKNYTGLTEHQKELMRMLYSGLSDKEIARETNAGNTSTIRNQRFAMREKYKQAKIVTAMTELLEEKRHMDKMAYKSGDAPGDELVDIHRSAAMTDERYAITEEERTEVLSRYFDSENRLLIKNIPVKEKRKIIILQHILKDFKPGRVYTEKEVNEIIKKYYEDVASIRRYFVNYGFLDRKSDCSEYWVKN